MDSFVELAWGIPPLNQLSWRSRNSCGGLKSCVPNRSRTVGWRLAALKQTKPNIFRVPVNHGPAWMPDANASSFYPAGVGFMMISPALPRAKKDIAYKYFGNRSLIPRRIPLIPVDLTNDFGSLRH